MTQTMTMDDIMNTIKSLACSQGMYGRLLNAIQNLDKDDYNRLKEDWESRGFKDAVDFVLFIEQ